VLKSATYYRDNDFEAFKFIMLIFKLAANDEKGVDFPLPRYPGSNRKSISFLIKNLENLTNLYKFATDNVLTESIGFSCPANSPTTKMFKNNIQKLFEAGIIPEKLVGVDYTQYENYKEVFQVVDNPKASYYPLNLTMLHAVFVIWLTAVGVSILVFFYEVIHYNLMVKIKANRKKKEKKKSKLNSKAKPLKLDLLKKTKWWLLAIYEIIKENFVR
jgi:hypothetical protein